MRTRTLRSDVPLMLYLHATQIYNSDGINNHSTRKMQKGKYLQRKVNVEV
jgi:hypothetical protein